MIVTDEPELIHTEEGIAPHVEIYHRNELDDVQRKLREISGVTALIYVQTCASENAAAVNATLIRILQSESLSILIFAKAVVTVPENLTAYLLNPLKQR